MQRRKMPEQRKNQTISFRPTEREQIEIETRIALSGMQKRQYIIHACIYANMVVDILNEAAYLFEKDGLEKRIERSIER